MHRANCDKQRGTCAMRADSRSVSQAGVTRPLILAGIASAFLHLAILSGLFSTPGSAPAEDAAAQSARSLAVSLNSSSTPYPESAPSGLPAPPEIIEQSVASASAAATTPSPESQEPPAGQLIVATSASSGSSVVANTPDTDITHTERAQNPLPVAAADTVDTSPPVSPDVQAMESFEQILLSQALQNLSQQSRESLAQLDAVQLLQSEQTYDVVVTHSPATSLTALDTYHIVISREADGNLYSTSAEFRERAFSHYAKFIHHWDPQVSLSKDWVGGRFHSNSPINLATDARTSPVFAGPVTLASAQHVSRRLLNSAMFQAGLETGTGRIALPDSASPGVFFPVAEDATTHYFDEDTDLEFRGNGSVDWTQAQSNRNGTIPKPENSLMLIARDNARFNVSGTINGSVLLYSGRRIMITGNLRYASRDSEPATVADYLTLISDGTIEIAVSSITGSGDLVIDGALFARQRFSVRRFRDREQGELIIFGTLVAGSVSATEPRFSTRIEYDPRYDTQRPPAFPSTGLYDLADWDRQWTVTAIADELLPDAQHSAQPLPNE